MNYKKPKLYDAGGNIEARWKVYYSFKEAETGKFIRITHYISGKYKTKLQRYTRAKEIIRELNIKLAKGFNPLTQQNLEVTRLFKALDNFLEAKRIFLRTRTFWAYRSYVKDFKTWAQEKNYDRLCVDEFTYRHASEYMESVAKRKISKRTYNNILQGIKTCFNYLVEKEYCTINPFHKEFKVELEECEIIAFNKAELKIISETLADYNFNLYVIALLIFNCFLRPQEIVRLRVRHLNALKDTLVISGDVSKNKRNETISLTNQVKNAVAKLNLNFPGDYFVFSTHLERGKNEVAPTRIARYWREYADSVHIDKNIYALKHTANGIAVENGANVRHIQLQNRHASLDQTQQYLDRFSRRVTNDFLKKLPDL